MSGKKASILDVDKMYQVGIPVISAEKTAQDYWNLFGIGPWAMVTLIPPKDTWGQTYHDKPTSYDFLCGFCLTGNMELEVMETLKGHTNYLDYINQWGEAPNHLRYNLPHMDDVHRHVELMAKAGYGSQMGGHFGDTGAYWYFDTVDDLGTIWEPVANPQKFEGPVENLPADTSLRDPSAFKIKNISGVGVVVRDLDKAIANYEKIIGVPQDSWKFTKGEAVKDFVYKGKAGKLEAKIATTDAKGPGILQLIQPLGSQSLYSDYASDRNRTGVQNIQFDVDNLAETTDQMKKMGFEILMSGATPDYKFAFYNTQGRLKATWQAIERT